MRHRRLIKDVFFRGKRGTFGEVVVDDEVVPKNE